MNHDPALALADFRAAERKSPLSQKSTTPLADLTERQSRYRLLNTEKDLRRISPQAAFETVIEAVKGGDVEGVAWMLYDGGYDPRFRISSGDKTLLIFAAENGHLPMVEFLGPMSDLDATNAYGHSALILAAARGHAASCSALISQGCRLSCDPDGMTPLMFASQFGRVSCIALLAMSCDVHAKDLYGRDALHLACEAGLIPAVEALLSLPEGPNLSSVQSSLAHVAGMHPKFANRDALATLLSTVELSMREVAELRIAAPRTHLAAKPNRI